MFVLLSYVMPIVANKTCILGLALSDSLVTIANSRCDLNKIEANRIVTSGCPFTEA